MGRVDLTGDDPDYLPDEVMGLMGATTDTKILSHLVDPRSQQDGGIGHSLKPLADHYLGAGAIDGQSALKARFRELGLTMATGWKHIPMEDETYLRYAGIDPILTFRLHDVLAPKVAEMGLEELSRFEHQVAAICAGISARGIRVARDHARATLAHLIGEQATGESTAASMGVDNIHAPKQIAEALLVRGVELTEKTTTGQWCMDKGVLDGIDDPLARVVRKAKGAGKAAKTYVEPILDQSAIDGRVHCRINPLGSKTGGNVRYSPHRDVTAYDPTRSAPGLDHVEIGYMLVERDPILRMLKAVDGYPDVAFSGVLRAAAAAGELGGLETGGAYCSVSDPIRLELTRDYFSTKKILLIDRDGTISQPRERGQYVETWEQFEFVPETVQAMRELADDGFEFIVITNQAGIALGVIEEPEVDRIHENMTAELGRRGIPVLDVYMSPDHWDSGSVMRKPAPGIFQLASDEHRFRLDRVLYVGDDIRDCQAAAAAGCGIVYLTEPGSVVQLPLNRRYCSRHRFLTDAVEVIRKFYGVEDGS